MRGRSPHVQPSAGMTVDRANCGGLPLPAGISPGRSTRSRCTVPTVSPTHLLPGTHLDVIELARPERVLRAAFSLAHPGTSDLLAAAADFLHADERAHLATLTFERRRNSYLLGRYAAKVALGALVPGVASTALAIRPGVFEFPVVTGIANVQVSISHAGEWGAAMAFPEAHPMAVDLELIAADRAEVIQSQLTAAEKARLGAGPLDGVTELTLLWTVKEAMAKVIRTGMMTPFEVFEVAAVRAEDGAFHSTFTQFGQYEAVSFVLPQVVATVIGPKHSRYQLRGLRELSAAARRTSG